MAVLPFDSISADPADAYLAQGLPEMILNRLSRSDGLSVIARNSSFALATKNIDSREIGRRLNSGYLIGGSVQREADRLRVAVQLVDSAAGTLIWSAHFDRGLHDIFSIEDEIADQIAGALSVRLGELEPKPPAGARSANLEAYLAFLRGRTLLGRFTVAESEAAVPYFERAIALDPNFASAYASLYDARMQAADQRREDLTLARQRYRHLIDRALELDPKLGAAYFARAMWGDEPHDASATPGNPLIVARERDFRQGAALDPSNGRGLGAYAEFLYWILGTTRGRQERSEARLVGRSDVTKCAFHGCRCSVSTIAAPRPPSKKHCRCWSSIRTSFRRCSTTEHSVGCSTASWPKPSRLSSMPSRSIRTILCCVTRPCRCISTWAM